MNPFRQSISRNIRTTLTAAVLSGTLASCGTVFDDLEPCPSGLEMRFVYDYNTERADAFAPQVDCLTLHIYDENGIYVTTATETSGRLADENFRLSLDLPSGSYHAVAYGGIACEDASFAHTSVPVSGSRCTDIDMTLLPSRIGSRLHDHFHGTVDFSIDPAATDYTEVTMSMKKTTNHFRILLLKTDGTPVDGNDFDFFITDDNSHLDHTNSPIAGHGITYPAWLKGTVSTADTDGQVERADDNDGTIDEAQAAFAELSTSRLHLSTSPYLIIREHEGDRKIVRLPLNTYLLMTLSPADGWGRQEYLDRCSRWNMTFFLDSNNTWLQTSIIINGWTVRINDMGV